MAMNTNVIGQLNVTIKMDLVTTYPTNATFAIYNDKFCGRRLKEFRASSMSFYGIITAATCTVGLLSNVFNVIVLTRKNAATSTTNAILTGISVADFFYLAFILIHTLLNYGVFTIDICVGHSHSFQLLSHISHRIYVTMHSISVVLTLMLAIWRYFAVAFPLKIRQWCSLNRTIVMIVACYLCVPLCNIPVYYMRETVDEVEYIAKDQMIPTIIVVGNNSNCTLYDVVDTEIAEINNFMFRDVGFWVHGALFQIAPSFLLMFFSVILVRALYKSSQQRSLLVSNISNTATLDQSCVRTTKMVLAVALLFLVTDLVQGILLIFGAVYGNDFYFTCYSDLVEVHDFLVIIDCSFNFIIYIVMSKQFRRNFKYLFVRRFIQTRDSVKSNESTLSQLSSYG